MLDHLAHGPPSSPVTDVEEATTSHHEDTQLHQLAPLINLVTSHILYIPHAMRFLRVVWGSWGPARPLLHAGVGRDASSETSACSAATTCCGA